MKNLFILMVIVGFSLLTQAQGNLQFNQVKLVTTVETVPAGKVWKIVNLTYVDIPNALNTTNIINYTASILVNGGNRQMRTIRGKDKGSSSPTEYWEQSFPLWLPEGTTLASSAGVFEISVIEFNIIP